MMLPRDMELGSLWVLELVYFRDMVGADTAIKMLNDGLTILRLTMFRRCNEDQI